MKRADADNQFMLQSDPAPPSTALMLTGGGARAAYQVGVLQAIADVRKAAGALDQPNPFPIITGTSAGAINAAALACGADNFDDAVRRVADVWANFQARQVYRSDALGTLHSGAGWMRLLSLGWLMAKWHRAKPRSLLDNSPLGELLTRMVPLQRLPYLVRKGHLQALAVSASSYSSGDHVTFYQGDQRLVPWVRSRRIGLQQNITHAHLLASSAIPFVFPATQLHIKDQGEYFGDGSMRQSSPLAAAIHLGARQILVVGAGRTFDPQGEAPLATPASYPSMAQIAGHALTSIFLDALTVDIERVRRINQTLSLVPPEARSASALREVQLLVIAPSQRIDLIAARHAQNLPIPVRALLGGVGDASDSADQVKGATLASYLLFETGFTSELMALGHADAMNQQAEICQFFGWTDPRPVEAIAAASGQPKVDRRRDPLRLRH